MAVTALAALVGDPRGRGPEQHRRVVAALHGQESPYFSESFYAFYCWNLILIPLVLLIGLTITLMTVSGVARTHGSAGAPVPGDNSA